MAVATKSPPAPAVPPDQPLDNLGWLLAQASHALSVEMTARLEELGIAPRGYCLLKTAMTGEYTQTELAQAVALDKTTMVVTVDALEASGLAERRPSANDRRAHVIAVTKLGRRKVDEAEAVVEQLHAGSALGAVAGGAQDLGPGPRDPDRGPAVGAVAVRQSAAPPHPARINSPVRDYLSRTDLLRS